LSFNSIIFVLLFLPASVLGYCALALTPLHRLRLPFLIVMSFCFYGRAQVTYIPLLLGSIVANYLIAVMIVRTMAHERSQQLWLALGVIANTGTLLSLKYLSAVVGTLAGSFGHTNPLAGIVAPLAISFYTFQQISFLVDVARGNVKLEGIVR
jgi:alginate O-acetyltransferase complex protein AlgI